MYNLNCVSMNTDVYRMLFYSFNLEEKVMLSDGFEKMLGRIVDIYGDMPLLDILTIRKIGLQDVFDEMQKMIPCLVPLLRVSIDQYGSEACLREPELKTLLCDGFNQYGIFPKITMDDGSRAFSLLQAAAWKVGLTDDNLRLWYKFMILVMGTAPAGENAYWKH